MGWEAWRLGALEMDVPENHEVLFTVVLEGNGEYLRDDDIGRRTVEFSPGMSGLTLPFNRMHGAIDPATIASISLPMDRFTSEMRAITGREAHDDIEDFAYGLHNWDFAHDLFRHLGGLIDGVPMRRDEIVEGAMMLMLPAFAQRIGIETREAEQNGTRLTEKQLRTLRAFVDANLANPISVHEMARHAGTSARHLSRLFQQTFGIGPYAWVQDYRLRRAREMLRAGMGNVTTVCFECGFSSPSSFAQRYRAKFGNRPSEDLLR